MGNKIYIGNLKYEATSKDLIDLFSTHGHVVEAMVIPDKNSPEKSKGFGFVTFSDATEASHALELNGSEFQGRKLVVELAREEGVESDKPPKQETIYKSPANGNQ